MFLIITRAVARTEIRGGIYFFSNHIQIHQFEKKSVGQNMNI